MKNLKIKLKISKLQKSIYRKNAKVQNIQNQEMPKKQKKMQKM